MPTLTLAKLLDNYDKTGKPEYLIASEVAATLDAKSVYTKFIPENEQILTKMHEIISKTLKSNQIFQRNQSRSF